MKRNLVSVTAGMATAGLIAGAAVVILPGAANAGDWNSGAGSIKDYGRAAVPVPAPVPVPDYAARWYLRGDASFGWLHAPSAGESGMTFGATDSPGATGPAPFGTSPAWFTKDFDTSASWGIGVGHYWSPRFRTDITADVASQQEIKGSGGYGYTQHGYILGVYQALNSTISGSISDKTTLKHGTVLFNAYYDLASNRGFTPYIGAGLGVSVNELERSVSWSEYICAAACASPAARAQQSAHAKTHNATFAWAFMVGTTYDLTRETKLDLNYRYLHIAGSHIDTPINGFNSRVSYGDFGEHQLRAGIRWNIE
jgi:opacity protein-like surface antigen